MNEVPLIQRLALDQKDAAKVLSVSVTTIARLEAEGVLKAISIGGTKRYATAHLNALLIAKDNTPEPGKFRDPDELLKGSK